MFGDYPDTYRRIAVKPEEELVAHRTKTKFASLMLPFSKKKKTNAAK